MIKYNTKNCILEGKNLNDWDNSFYPEIFHIPFDIIYKWSLSGSFFCSAIIKENRYKSILSFLLVKEEQFKDLYQGKIEECDLLPYIANSCDNAGKTLVFYLGSLVIGQKRDFIPLIKSTFAEINNFRQKNNIKVNKIVCIAANLQAKNFWESHGFVEISKYHEKYPIIEYKFGGGNLFDKILDSS